MAVAREKKERRRSGDEMWEIWTVIYSSNEDESVDDTWNS